MEIGIICSIIIIFTFCFVMFCVLSTCCLVVLYVLSVYCLVVMYLGCGMWFEVIYLFVGSGCRDPNNFYDYKYVFVVSVCVLVVFFCLSSFFFNQKKL